MSFQWKGSSDRRTHLGLLAQEVEKAIPEAVHRDPDPAVALGMNYANLIPVLIKAIQEQQATITALKAESAELKQRNTEQQPCNSAVMLG